MRVFAIGDPHLGFAMNKPMDIFGDHWKDHPEKIAKSWRELVQPEDLVLVVGDISWALNLNQASPDLAFLGRLPGQKVLTKGNHDHWWESTGKVQKACPPGMMPLLNSTALFGDLAIAAARGWDYPGSPDWSPEAEKMYNREMLRLDMALQSARKQVGQYRHLLMMIHYPPLLDPTGEHNASRAVISQFVPAMKEAGVQTCVHGHVHGTSLAQVVEGDVLGIRFHCVSADWVDFTPRLVLEL
jgi:predicted phosphohydrolase